MIQLSELNLEYRDAKLSLIYATIDGILYATGTMKSTVFLPLEITWSPWEEGETIDDVVSRLKSIIDFHHARKAIEKVFDT